MKKYHRSIFFLVIILSTALIACGNNAVVPTATKSPIVAPAFTHTPDPCAPGNINTQVQEIHKYMREFDDASSLASVLPADQLDGTVANLQRIRREAEDQPTPPCLINLKTFQVSHMNSVINTMINLIGYANGTVDKQVIDQGIALAREQHDKYTLELARVLGLTVVPANDVASPTQTPVP